MKRKLSLLLILCMLFSYVPTSNVLISQAKVNTVVTLEYNGEKTSNMVIDRTEGYKLTARYSVITGKPKYSWQIYTGDEWVDFYGATSKTFNLTYAKIKSAIVNDSARIRCGITTGEDTYYSEPLSIIVENTLTTGIIVDDTSAMVTGIEEPDFGRSNEYVFVAICYRDSKSNEQIYSPYTARIEPDTDFHQTVTSPTFLGYAPYYYVNGVKTNALHVTLNYKNVTENKIIDVFYEPINVGYAIRYYFQNVNDDLYTENESLYYEGEGLTGTIITNEEIVEHAGNTTGFEKLYHYPESIAADGSTVFECYYDRNYYLMKFDPDGGYGVEPIYAKFGTAFVVNTPIKPGYVFKGWDLLDATGEGDGKADVVPGAIPAESQSYIALWGSVDTTATIVYWLQDANNGEKYNYWGSYKVAAKSGDTINGKDYKDYSSIANRLDKYEKRYSYFNESKSSQDVIVEGDGSTTVNVYYDRNDYTLKFYYAMSNSESHYVVGGSTYAFGAEGSSTASAIQLLDTYTTTYKWQRGIVTELPELNDRGLARGYTVGSDKSTDGTYDYHYISFTCKYGADISELWPCDVFDSVQRKWGNTHGNWDGMTAYISAWNGEHHVYYSQHNTNQTVKGNYRRLDYKLLYDVDKGYKDSSEVAYLCFWENGADVTWSIPRLWRYNLWVPVESNESNTGLTTIERNGVTYKLFATYDTCDDDTSVDAQTESSLDGFTFKEKVKSDIPTPDGYNDAFQADFYYERNQYNLSLHNYNEEISSINAVYNEPLDGNFMIPDYPDSLEENAYEFDGWYTTAGCYKGTEFGTVDGFNGKVMPASNLILYAKWKPKVHTVRIFQTYQDMLDYQKDSSNDSGLLSTNHVSHGRYLERVASPVDKTDNNYSFSGWFYETLTGKAAFTPYDMPIKKDLNVFAEWSSYTSQPYLLHYVLQATESSSEWIDAIRSSVTEDPVDQKRYDVVLDAEKRSYIYYKGDWHRCVANDTTGYAYQGTTRTFTAKAGEPFNQLFSDFRDGYYPTIATHSITIQQEDLINGQPENNVFTFEYVNTDNVTYRVRYLDKNTGKMLADDEFKTTPHSVVTERFKVITDYVPDAFYKRLVMAVKEDPDNPGNYIGADSNILTFYYTPNKTAAYYAIHFMLQDVNTTGNNYDIENGDYAESDTHIEGIGDIGSIMSVEPLTFTGYTIANTYKVKVDDKVSTSSETDYNLTISDSGSEIYLYYKRNQYNFTVQYLDYTTKKPVADPDTITDVPFDSTVTRTAKGIEGKSCVSALTQSAVCKAKENQNVITFYYIDLQYTVEYKVVGDGGSLSSSIEVKDGNNSFDGSEPISDDDYKFSGWYYDEECRLPVGSSAADTAKITGDKIVPINSMLNPTPQINIYYAKFTPYYQDLVITRSNAVDEDHNDRTFIYRVESTDDPDFVIYATIVGNGSTTIKNLKAGEYTVTQENDWSWRYNDESQIVVLAKGKNVSVTFNESAVNKYWLSGNGGRGNE